MPKKLELRQIRKALLVYKKSSYEDHALDKKEKNFLKLLKEKNTVLKKSKDIHETHTDSLSAIKKYLEELNIEYDVCLRFELRPIHGYDLVITIGGDGTFLETSHFLTDSPLLLGVNSVPHDSIGYFCKATASTFLEKMYLLVKGQAKIQELHRLQVTIGDYAIPYLALNDVLFASQNPAGTTRYLLKIGKSLEEQKSSGIWISAAAGSTAAIMSAGGKKLPIGSTDFQYKIREPYEPKGRKKYAFKGGLLTDRQKLEIISAMDDAAIFIDGPHQIYPIKRGSRVCIEHSDYPIHAVWG